MVVFGIVRKHNLFFYFPRIFPVINNNRYRRNVLLPTNHNLKPVLDELWNKTGVRIALVLFDKTYQKFGFFGLWRISAQLKREGDIATPIRNGITERFGNFLKGIEIYCCQELSKCRVFACRKMQKFRSTGWIFEKRSYIRIVQMSFFYHDFSTSKVIEDLNIHSEIGQKLKLCKFGKQPFANFVILQTSDGYDSQCFYSEAA